MPQSVTSFDADGNRASVEFHDEALAQGGEGNIYLSTDNNSVIKLFHDSINKKLDVLQQILKARPPAGDPVAKFLAWPCAVLVDDTGRRAVGVVMPNVQRDGWMEKLSWYRSFKAFGGLSQNHPDRKGDFKGRVEAAMGIAAAARYLNRIGYSHADFSGNNIFVNPVSGRSMVIDLDGLIVPGYISGEVLGTPGYMAPELVTRELKSPDKMSDCHALAVVLYQFLLMGHPLKGGRPAMHPDAEIDDELMYGKYALYREHSSDPSNHPEKKVPTSEILGHEMEELFRRAFETGLKYPNRHLRPYPDEFESTLRKLRDDLLKCTNSQCFWGYFPSQDGRIGHCPACGAVSSEVIRGWVQILRTATQSNGFYGFQKQVTAKLTQSCGLTAQQIFGKGGSQYILAIKPTPDEKVWEIQVMDKKVICEVIAQTHGHLKVLPPGRPEKVQVTTWLRVSHVDQPTKSILIQFNRKPSFQW